MEVRELPAVTIQEVKKGKRTYGAFFRFDDGRLAYMAYRKHREIYRAGRSTISDAVRDGVAGWALDDETVLAARAKGAKYVGVLVMDTGDKYVAYLDQYFARPPDKRWTFHDYEKLGGSKQRVLPLQEFKVKLGERESLHDAPKSLLR